MSKTIAQLAHEASEWFERRTRDDGSTFETMRDGRPDWVESLTYDAHGDFGPEDWRYGAIIAALSHVSDCDYGDADEAREGDHEFADGHVDIYTGARLEWLASNLNRAGYVDDAVEEIGSPELGIVERIGLGQYAESREVYESVISSLEAQLEAEEEEVTGRLEYLRGELRAERISYGELAELQGLAEHIAEGDVELREAAGLPEFTEDVDG